MPLVLLKSDPRARLKPCLRCGYSLRNIIDARNCPECGLAIRLSLGGDDALELSRPEWVGATAAALAVAALPHLVALAVVVVALAQALGEERGLARHLLFQTPPVAFVAGLLLVVRHAAMLIMARSEGRVPERARRLRWTLLVSAVSGSSRG